MRLWLELQQSREWEARRTHKTCSSTLLPSSPALLLTSAAWPPPSLPPAPDLCHPSKPQGMAGIPEKLWLQVGWLPATSSTAASVLGYFFPYHSTRFLFSSSDFSPLAAPALFSFPSLAVFLPLLFHLSAHHAPHTEGKQQAMQYNLVSHN